MHWGGAGYISPVCSCLEISQEGILCASATHEAFDELTNYGSGLDNRGWN